MKTLIKIKIPSKWKKNYLIDVLKKKRVEGKYVEKNIDPNTELLVSNYLTKEEMNSLLRLKYLILPTSGTDGVPLEEIKKEILKYFKIKKLFQKVLLHIV
jgi:hypothetical protein